MMINSARSSFGTADRWIFDNSAEIHIINDAQRAFFRPTSIPKAFSILAGNTEFPAVALGVCELTLPREGGKAILLELHDVVYCPGFHVSIVSESILRKKLGIWYHGKGRHAISQEQTTYQDHSNQWFRIAVSQYRDTSEEVCTTHHGVAARQCRRTITR